MGNFDTIEGREQRSARYRRATSAAATAVALMTAAACTSSDSSGATSEDELREIDVSVIPIAEFAPLYLGAEEGFFEEEGLTVNIETSTGGAAILPAVYSGDAEFGITNVASLINALDQGLDVPVVSAGNYGGATEEDATFFMLVAEGSDIETSADLEGRTVAINTLLANNQMAIQTALENLDVDFNQIEFVELPFPDMPAALENGQVDAISTSEPFATLASDNGARIIMSPDVEARANLLISVYITSRQVVENDPELVDAFRTAITRSLEFSQDNPERIREILPDFTGTTEDIANRIALPTWRPEIDQESIDLYANQMVNWGWVNARPEVTVLGD